MSDITVRIAEDEPIDVEFVEARIKPEQEKSVTPAYSSQVVEPDAGMTLSKVNVAAIPDPTDIKEISANGDHDVRRYGTARVAVPQGVFPAGTLEIAANGTYNVEPYAAVDVDVQPSHGIVLSDYDEDGYPLTLTAYGYDPIPQQFLDLSASSAAKSIYGRIKNVRFVNCAGKLNNFAVSIASVEYVDVCDGITECINYAFRASSARRIVFRGDVSLGGYIFYGSGRDLRELIFEKNVVSWHSAVFAQSNAAGIELYDFSHCEAVFALPSVDALPHAEGCVVRVPQGMLAEWRAAAVWTNLTGVVWESV